MPKSAIPKGPYCYERDADGKAKACPFWGLNPDLPPQMNGCCSYLSITDSDNGPMTHLFDQVKECDINMDEAL